MHRLQTSPKGKQGLRRAGAAGLALLLVTAGAFFLWARTTPDPGPGALAALESDAMVRVVEDDGYTFQPAQQARTGLIFYPGGRVDPAGYAGTARKIAEAGYLVIVPRLTLNLAVLDANAADVIIDAHPGIEHWVIGGHSLGGVMAASYAGAHPETISGVVLWAAYPSGGTDLSAFPGPVVVAFGTLDGLTTTQDIDDSRLRLPGDTTFVAIEGGNHAQFGDYGSQSGDNPAIITREAQQAGAVRAALVVLEAVG